jgi:hypothetical protein
MRVGFVVYDQRRASGHVPQERAAVEIEVIDRLDAWTGSDGRFIWKPELIRIIAKNRTDRAIVNSR